MIGWANYFCLGPVRKAYRAVERHTCRRLREWLRVKHKRQGAGTKRYSDQLLHDKFGLSLTHYDNIILREGFLIPVKLTVPT